MGRQRSKDYLVASKLKTLDLKSKKYLSKKSKNLKKEVIVSLRSSFNRFLTAEDIESSNFDKMQTLNEKI